MSYKVEKPICRAGVGNSLNDFVLGISCCTVVSESTDIDSWDHLGSLGVNVKHLGPLACSRYFCEKVVNFPSSTTLWICDIYSCLGGEQLRETTFVELEGEFVIYSDMLKLRP